MFPIFSDLEGTLAYTFETDPDRNRLKQLLLTEALGVKICHSNPKTVVTDLDTIRHKQIWLEGLSQKKKWRIWSKSVTKKGLERLSQKCDGFTPNPSQKLWPEVLPEKKCDGFGLNPSQKKLTESVPQKMWRIWPKSVTKKK